MDRRFGDARGPTDPWDPTSATQRFGRPTPPPARRAWSEEADEQAPTSYAALPDAPTQYRQAAPGDTAGWSPDPAVSSPPPSPPPLPPLPWWRRPGVLFGIAATAAALSVAGLIATTLPGDDSTTPSTRSATVPPPRSVPATPGDVAPTSPAGSAGSAPATPSCPEGTVASGDRCIANPRMCPDGTVVGLGEPCAGPRRQGRRSG